MYGVLILSIYGHLLKLNICVMCMHNYIHGNYQGFIQQGYPQTKFILKFSNISTTTFLGPQKQPQKVLN